MTDTSTAKTFSEFAEEDLIEAGTYEVVLEAEKREFGENKENIGLFCKFRIRNDVDQAYKGRVVFDMIWKDKDQVEWKDWFDHRKLHKIILTQEKPKLSFNNPDECIQYINGLSMRINIEKTFDDYRGKYINKVAYLSYDKSNVKSVNAITADEPADDDLPF